MSRISAVVDASAVLAYIFREPTIEQIDVLDGAGISTVNVAELVAKLIERGIAEDEVAASLQELDLEIVPFDFEQALVTARLRERTRHLGLSLGDHACIALALGEGVPVVTADKSWATLDLGARVILVR